MSGIQGDSPGGRNIRKQGVKESTFPATGVVDIAFLHETAAGDTIIDVTALTVPASAVDYNPPSVADLTKDNLKKIKENITLESTTGPMIQNIDYVVNGATTIRLLQPALGGTIIRGLIRSSTRQLTSAVDATPLVVTGSLPAGQTDFNVGVPFEVGKFISQQVGQVLVFEDSQQVFRRVGNQPTGIGDYYEVHAGAGLGTIIRFPASGADRNILVIAPGGLFKNPTASQDALIETLQSQIDDHRQRIEVIGGVPVPPGGANNVDLKAFGDRVLTNEQLIATLLTAQVPITTNWAATTMNLDADTTAPTKGSTVGEDKCFWRRNGNNIEITWDYIHTAAGTAGSGIYRHQPAILDGLTVDTAKISSNNIMGNRGNVSLFIGSGTSGIGFVQWAGVAGTNSKPSISFYTDAEATTNQDFHRDTFFSFAQAELRVSAFISLPIAGWAATQTLAEQLGL